MAHFPKPVVPATANADYRVDTDDALDHAVKARAHEDLPGAEPRDARDAKDDQLLELQLDVRAAAVEGAVAQPEANLCIQHVSQDLPIGKTPGPRTMNCANCVIANKRASGRKQDLADLEVLQLSYPEP